MMLAHSDELFNLINLNNITEGKEYESCIFVGTGCGQQFGKGITG
jgi:hypothetical protein